MNLSENQTEELGVVAIFFDLKQEGNFSNPFLDALQAAKVHKKNKTYSDELSTRLSRL